MQYAGRYDDVPLVVNLAGRFDCKAGIVERFGARTHVCLRLAAMVGMGGGMRTIPPWVLGAVADARPPDLVMLLLLLLLVRLLLLRRPFLLNVVVCCCCCC